MIKLFGRKLVVGVPQGTMWHRHTSDTVNVSFSTMRGTALPSWVLRYRTQLTLKSCLDALHTCPDTAMMQGFTWSVLWYTILTAAVPLYR